MNDYFVFVVCHNLVLSGRICDFFEEEETLILDWVKNNPVQEGSNLLSMAAADLVVCLERSRDYLVERVCKRWGIPYVKVDSVDDAQEIIAEKFVEWSEENGA